MGSPVRPRRHASPSPSPSPSRYLPFTADLIAGEHMFHFGKGQSDPNYAIDLDFPYYLTTDDYRATEKFDHQAANATLGIYPIQLSGDMGVPGELLRAEVRIVKVPMYFVPPPKPASLDLALSGVCIHPECR